MAVPSSGELELRGDIALEVYGSATGTNISLGAMSDIAGFTSPDAMTDFYGWSNSVAPSVTTNSLTSVTGTTMTLNGNATSDGGATITERGFYFGTNSVAPTNNTKYAVAGTTGSYTLGRTGLSGSTTYYCWAFATNSVGTTYGSRTQATTAAVFSPTYTGDLYSVQADYNIYATSAFTVTRQTSYIDPYTSSLVTMTYDAWSGSSSTGYVTKQWYQLSGALRRKFCTNAHNVYYMGYTGGNVNYTSSVKAQVFDSTWQTSNRTYTYSADGITGIQNTNQQFYVEVRENSSPYRDPVYVELRFDI